MVKYINELINKHKGNDIYVICSGKSLDFIDNSFFDNKITVGVNQSYKKFEPTYLIRKDSKVLINAINTCKKTIHIISEGRDGAVNDFNKNIITTKFNNNNQIFLFKHLQNIHDVNENNVPKENDKLVVSYSTVTTAIHFAQKLGAKNIIIVGHDCGLINGEENFKGYHTEKTIAQKNKNEYIKWLGEIEKDTINLKKYLQKNYKINIYSLNPFINFNLEGNLFKKI